MYERDDMGKVRRGEREREIQKRLKKQKKTSSGEVTQRLSINHSHPRPPAPGPNKWTDHVITDSSGRSSFARSPGREIVKQQ